ncbi:solute carrier family 25 protein [Amniculicola lignicola CBS 123094]|uniref:Solute carrier family 25 protein n=1 Tax=Amniculicola lignicola CBS 123094 TaxID=1392246 RepID=A0A6A5WWT3_9PLEO|nr:solute carrier family 25 protein [Amniculicola lignicola CBS 123094]
MPRALPPIEGNKGLNISPSIVESVAGFSAGVVSCLTVHPLDLLKNRLQRTSALIPMVAGLDWELAFNTSTASRPGDSLRIFSHVIRDEGGVRALYRGLWPNMLGNSLGWGLYFLFYRNMKDLLQARRPKGEYLSSAEFFSASIIAGLLTGACTNPIWVVKTRMLERGANHPEAYKSMWIGMKHVYTTRGLKGLWAGFIPSTLGVAHGAVQFAIYEKMKHHRGDKIGGQGNLSNWDYIYMSGSSKLLAGAITYPYQPIRARMQQYDAAKKYNGLVDVIVKTWRNEGFLAFYKGVIPNTIRVVPTTVVTFVVYENTKIYLPKAFDGEEAAHDED